MKSKSSLPILSIYSLYDYIFGDKAALEDCNFVAPKKTLKTQPSYDLLLRSSSPLNLIMQNLSRPSYILSPEGLYFLSDITKPVCQDDFLPTKTFQLKELPANSSIKKAKAKNSVIYSFKNGAAEETTKRITLKKYIFYATIQEENIQYAFLSASQELVIDCVAKVEFGPLASKGQLLAAITQLCLQKGQIQLAIDTLWKQLAENNNGIPCDAGPIAISQKSDEQALISLHTNHVPDYKPTNQSNHNVSEEDLQKVKERKLSHQRQKKEEFAAVLSTPELAKLFRQDLKILKATALESLLFGDTDEDNFRANENMPNDGEIIKLFESLDQEYQFFGQDQEKQKEFIVFFKICKLMVDFFEQDPQEGIAALNAYKILVLFGFANKGNPFNDLEAFLILHQGYQKERPIHDTLIYDLPINEPPIKDLNGWRGLIQTHGMRCISYFQEAPKIEQALSRVPKDMKETKIISAQLAYQRYAEYPELANLAKFYHLSEVNFNKCLEVEKRRKTSDNLPNVCIAGKQLGHPNFFLAKLPISDPRAYLLGHITNSCQSMGGNAEQCVIDGITFEDNGFYVLLQGNKQDSSLASPFTATGSINYKDFAIVGQAYAWNSKLGNLALDSWEGLRPEDDEIVKLMLEEFGRQVTASDSDSLRVTIGGGGKTPTCLKTTEIQYPETMRQGVQHGDSTEQFLVYLNTEKRAKMIKDLVGDLAQQYPLFWENADDFKKFIPEADIYSLKQISCLISCISNLLFNAENQNFWRNLMTEENKKLLQTSIVNRGVSTWEVLDLVYQFGCLNSKSFPVLMVNSRASLELLTQLNQLGLLSKSYCESILSNHEEAKTQFERAKSRLNSDRLETPTHLTICLRDIENAGDRAFCLVELNRRQLLDDAYRQTLLQSSSRDEFNMARARCILKEDQLLTDSNWQIFESLISNKGNKEEVRQVAMGFVVLQREGILDEPNKQAIRNNPAHAWKLAENLLTFHRANLLDPPTRSLLIANSKFELKSIFYVLYENKLLASTFQLIFDNSETAASIYPHLSTLAELKTINYDNVESLVRGSKSPHFKGSQSVFERFYFTKKYSLTDEYIQNIMNNLESWKSVNNLMFVSGVNYDLLLVNIEYANSIYEAFMKLKAHHGLYTLYIQVLQKHPAHAIAIADALIDFYESVKSIDGINLQTLERAVAHAEELVLAKANHTITQVEELPPEKEETPTKVLSKFFPTETSEQNNGETGSPSVDYNFSKL